MYNASEELTVWENIKDHIRTSGKESLGPYELKQHKAWFDEECFTIFRSMDAGWNVVGTGSQSEQCR